MCLLFSYSGGSLHFHGWNIILEVIKSLMAKGLSSADQVVIAGSRYDSIICNIATNYPFLYFNQNSSRPNYRTELELGRRNGSN